MYVKLLPLIGSSSNFFCTCTVYLRTTERAMALWDMVSDSSRELSGDAGERKEKKKTCLWQQKLPQSTLMLEESVTDGGEECFCAFYSNGFPPSSHRLCAEATACEPSFVGALQHDVIWAVFSLLLSCSRSLVLTVILLNCTIVWGAIVLTSPLDEASDPPTWTGSCKIR